MEIFADNELEAIRLAIIFGVSKHQYAKAKKIKRIGPDFRTEILMTPAVASLKEYDSDRKFFNREY